MTQDTARGRDASTAFSSACAAENFAQDDILADDILGGKVAQVRIIIRPGTSPLKAKEALSGAPSRDSFCFLGFYCHDTIVCPIL